MYLNNKFEQFTEHLTYFESNSIRKIDTEHANEDKSVDTGLNEKKNKHARIRLVF